MAKTPWAEWTVREQMICAAALLESRGDATVVTRNNGAADYRQFGLYVRADNPVHPAMMQQLFGGSVSNKTADRKRNWIEWRVFGEAALRALDTLMPYLLVRRDDFRQYLDKKVLLAGRIEPLKRARVRTPRVPQAPRRAKAQASA